MDLSSKPRRHLIVSDTQIRPGVPTDHIDWCAQAIVDYLPDVVVVLGDWWDLHSLSTYATPGSKETEGASIYEDIAVGNEAFERLVAPMEKEIARRKRRKILQWNPERHLLSGNHEHRLNKAIEREPKWAGILSPEMLVAPGFTRHPFLKIVEIDGIKYCHYFPNPFSGKPIGGTIINRLGHIGSSFVQGHQQGFMYASKQYPDHVKHGLVTGRFYQHHEAYRPEDVQNSEWNGIVVLNEVRNGDFSIMPLSMDYLRRTYS